MSEINTSSFLSVEKLFASNLIGDIALPVKNLERHPRQRHFRPNHASQMVDSMHQTSRRASFPISVVLPPSTHVLDEHCSRWVESASQGTLDSAIPESLVLYVIDGWHRTHAAQQYLHSFVGSINPPSPAALVWPAKVYKSAIFDCLELKTWQTTQNISTSQEPASFYEQLEGLNDLKRSNAPMDKMREQTRLVFSQQDVAAAACKLPYTIIWEPFFSYVGTPLGEAFSPSMMRGLTPWDMSFDFLKRMFEDAVAQHHRILETYTDDDKVNFRLGHLMGVTDGKGFTGDKRTMRTLWNQIKVNFKQSSFEDWWDTIHNCTPRALYGELIATPRLFNKKAGERVAELIPMYSDAMAKLMVLLHGGSFSMTIRSRGSGQIGIPWSGQMGIDEHNKSSFDMLIQYIGEKVGDLVPTTPQDPPIYWCQTAHSSYSLSSIDYESMMWSGFTDPKEFTAWSNLLDFAETIGFSRHKPLWEFAVEKAARRGKKPEQVNPMAAVARDPTPAKIGERSSARIRSAVQAQAPVTTPLHNRVRVGRGRGVKAGKGRGGRAGLAVVRRKRVVDRDYLESEESDGEDNSEEGEGGGADGQSGDEEDDDDHEGKGVVDTDGDGDLAFMGGDDPESMEGERDSNAGATVDAENVDAMDLDMVDHGGGLARGKRRAEGQLVPRPSRGKQARTSIEPSTLANPLAPSPISSALIQDPPSKPQFETMQQQQDPFASLMTQAQRLQLLVLGKATEATKRDILQKVVQFTEEVMTMVESGADRPSPTTMQLARDQLENIRESSVGTPL